MSQELKSRHSIPSILSCSQQPRKKKRISFSANMLCQEYFEDGTTKTYEERVDESSAMAMTLEESDSILNMTVFEFDMDLSSPTMGSPNVSPARSPPPPQTSTIGSLNGPSPPPTSPALSPPQTLTSIVSSPNVSAATSPPPTSPAPLPNPPPPQISIMGSPNVSLAPPPPPTSPAPLLTQTSPLPPPPQISTMGSPNVSPAPSPPPPPQISTIGSPNVSSATSPPPTSPAPLSTPTSTTGSPNVSPVVASLTSSALSSPIRNSTISFSTDESLELSRRDNSFACSTLFGPSVEATDSLYDSILVYAEEKTFLESSGEELSPCKSKDTSYNTTFVASIFNDISIENSTLRGDEVFGFVENSMFSKLPANIIDISSIDPTLSKFIVDLNDDCATLKFMQGNFVVNIKYSVIDSEKTEVALDSVSLECLIDAKIQQQVFTPLSEHSIHLLTKPRDEKLIKLIKKTVATHLQQFARENESTTNSLSNIIKKLRKIFSKVEAVFIDLCNVARFYEWKIINSNIRNFEIAFEIFGLRYSLWLVLSFDLLGYPSNTIKVKFGVHKADLKLYPYHLFHKVMRSVSPGTHDYIAQTVKTAIKFILDWRHNHSKKTIRLSLHPSRRTMGEQTIKNLNK